MFVQDDWRLTPDVKLLYGVRYDVYDMPDGNPDAPFATSRDFAVSKEQLRPARRRGLDARRSAALGAPRQHRPDVRPAAQRDVRAGAASTTAPTRAPRPASPRPQAGAPAFPNVLSTGAGAQPNLTWTVDPDFTVGARVAEQRPVRARAGRHLRHRRRHVLRARLRPAGRDQRQPDQPDRHAAGRPPDLRDGGQRRHARRSALQHHQQDAVARRVHLQEHDAAVHRGA